MSQFLDRTNQNHKNDIDLKNCENFAILTIVLLQFRYIGTDIDI